MHIECFKLNGVDYLRLAESYSVQENGITKQKKRIVFNIGPLKRFDDGAPEYLARLRVSFKNANPLIPSLATYINAASPIQDIVNIPFDRNSPQDICDDPKNIGAFLLEALYDQLGISEVLTLHRSRADLKYDLNGLTKMLTIGRALHPESKIRTFDNRDSFLVPVTDSEDWHEVFYCLDELAKKEEAVQKRMNSSIDKAIGRNRELAFYDVTNYYFEIEDNDEDLDETPSEDNPYENKGIRKNGVCKEKRKQPIVQMGLFMDDRGIPISYQLFPGNILDQLTLRPAMKRTVDQYEFDRIVVVADRGLTNDKNIAHILNSGNGYVFSKSIKKCKKEERKWVLDPQGYTSNAEGSFKSKTRLVTRTIKDENDKPLEITEKILCYWSKRFYERELKENETFLQTLQLYIDNPSSIKSEKGKLKQFLVESNIDPETGEILKTKKLQSINLDKAMEFRELMGYYMIVTSEAGKTEDQIIDTYRGLTKIENAFRILKGDLSARPVFVSSKQHIHAHFLICFIALVMMRLIQFKILQFQGKHTTTTFDWEEGLSAARIQAALQNFTANPLPRGYYRLSKPTEDLSLILKALGIEHGLKLPSLSELKQYRFRVRKMKL